MTEPPPTLDITGTFSSVHYDHKVRHRLQLMTGSSGISLLIVFHPISGRPNSTRLNS